jgi:hypothetical protein
MQEVGLRISLALGSCARPESGAQTLLVGRGAPKKDVGVAWEGQPRDDLRDEAQLGVQTPREDCTVVRRQNFVGQDHSASGHAQRYATAWARCEPSGSGTTGDCVTERGHFAQRSFRTS